jgi:hypothetical protein
LINLKSINVTYKILVKMQAFIYFIKIYLLLIK